MVTFADFDLFTAAKRLPRASQKGSLQRRCKPTNPAKITWHGAKDYCGWLRELTGQPYDLPTEAHCDDAARSGSKWNPYVTDNCKLEAGRNYPSNAQKDAAAGRLQVGSSLPNDWRMG